MVGLYASATNVFLVTHASRDLVQRWQVVVLGWLLGTLGFNDASAYAEIHLLDPGLLRRGTVARAGAQILEKGQR